MNIFFIILGIAFAVATVVYFIFINKPKAIVGVIGAILALALIVVGASIVVIPTGYTGIKSTFGQVDPNPVPQGFSFKAPFITSVEKINNKQQDVKITEVQIWGESSEKTPVYATSITVSYKIKVDKTAWLYANVSKDFDDLVSEELVSTAIKTAMVQLNNKDVTVRNKIVPIVKENLQNAIDEKYSKDAIDIVQVVIDDMDFEDSFNQAIAAKSIAQQTQEKQEIENKTAISKAEADKKVAIAKAEAKAESKRIEAEAEAKANKLINESLNDRIIENKKIEKWNGVLPQVSGDSGVMIDFTQSNK